jgi:SNF2 family DNA or RNA helicase
MLKTILRDPTEKVIIFTHFRRTLEKLADLLQKMGVDFVQYHGEMDMPSKNQAITEFERRANILLSTEAAGEGRNLQFCRTMINFDIPWNPMRIEQRGTDPPHGANARVRSITCPRHGGRLPA